MSEQNEVNLTDAEKLELANYVLGMKPHEDLYHSKDGYWRFGSNDDRGRRDWVSNTNPLEAFRGGVDKNYEQ